MLSLSTRFLSALPADSDNIYFINKNWINDGLFDFRRSNAYFWRRTRHAKDSFSSGIWYARSISYHFWWFHATHIVYRYTGSAIHAEIDASSAAYTWLTRKARSDALAPEDFPLAKVLDNSLSYHAPWCDVYSYFASAPHHFRIAALSLTRLRLVLLVTTSLILPSTIRWSRLNDMPSFRRVSASSYGKMLRQLKVQKRLKCVSNWRRYHAHISLFFNLRG